MKMYITDPAAVTTDEAMATSTDKSKISATEPTIVNKIPVENFTNESLRQGVHGFVPFTSDEKLLK
jgi:hypothetical protein